MSQDISGELAKRISRRQFLFGGTNRSGGDAGVGPLGVVLGAAGVGLGVMGLASPGPSAQSFQDAYVQKKPTVQNILDPSGMIDVSTAAWRIRATTALPDPLWIENIVQGTNLAWFFLNNGIEMILTVPNMESAAGSFMSISDVTSNQTFQILAYDTLAKAWYLGAFEGTDPANSKQVRFRANSSGFGGSVFGFGLESELGTDASAGLHSAGAQVGLPTGAAGGASTFPALLCLSGHRHAFSGRFNFAGSIQDASLGGALPAKFARIISNNNWTLRRISVYALTAPGVAGTDTYGVVNAAGTLQGTAVSLAVGVKENATALQVTNLTGGTVYYIAVTARATVPALDVNVEVEYTMNV